MATPYHVISWMLLQYLVRACSTMRHHAMPCTECRVSDSNALRLPSPRCANAWLDFMHAGRACKSLHGSAPQRCPAPRRLGPNDDTAEAVRAEFGERAAVADFAQLMGGARHGELRNFLDTARGLGPRIGDGPHRGESFHGELSVSYSFRSG